MIEVKKIIEKSSNTNILYEGIVDLEMIILLNVLMKI